MRAFVLSGGGNRGPLQVGALIALLQAGIVPEMIVGSSAGALNGAFLALDPCLAQARAMTELWREAGRRKIVNANPVAKLLRLARGDAYIVDNARMRRFVHDMLPADRRCFGDLPIPLWVTIAHLVTHTLYVYGDDPKAIIADAIVTSAAVPGFFPPLIQAQETFVDGGVVSNLPVQLAIARGATEIWAIDLAIRMNIPQHPPAALGIMGMSVMPLLYKQMLLELEAGARTHGVTLHHVPIYDHQAVALGDFKHNEAMFTAGEKVMQTYLEKPEPNVVHYPARHMTHELPQGPAGSRPFIL